MTAVCSWQSRARASSSASKDRSGYPQYSENGICRPRSFHSSSSSAAAITSPAAHSTATISP